MSDGTTRVEDEDIVTTWREDAKGPGSAPTASVGPQDADGTDGDGTDGVDGDGGGGDADGTDGGDADGTDADGTDQ